MWRLLHWRNLLRYSLPGMRVRRKEDDEVRRLGELQRAAPSALVATIVPTFDRPELVVRAVTSALNQTVTDQVVIVVSDGSDLPEMPPDPRLYTYRLSTNIGVAGSVRNVGIRLSSSRFVAFLDDDNEWEPNHLRTAIDELDRGADLVYTAVTQRRSDGTLIGVLSTPFDRRLLADVSYVDTNAVVVRRDPKVLFDRMPRTRTTYPREDWAFVFRLSRSRRVVHVKTPTVRYLVNDQSYFSDWSHVKRDPE